MIPFVDLQAQFRKIESSVRRRMDAVLAHGQFIMGPEVGELEKELGRYVGVEHAISCSSGTDALVMALMALGIGPGDCVFVPVMTFIATSEAVERVGARPCFVDVDPRTFNLDPSDLERRIRDAKADPKCGRPAAVMVVNLFGLCADFEAIDAIAKKHGLEVVEDAAQSFGAVHRGRKSGALAKISCTSFFPAKPLGGYGDGGAIFTSDAAIADALRSMRVHGQGRERYEHVRLGFTARLDTLQAAILLAKMEVFEEEILARGRVAQTYSRFLGELPKAPVTPMIPANERSAWAQYSITFADRASRDAARKGLEASGIPSVVYYPIPLHRQPVYAALGYAPGDFPNAVRMSETILSLPMHPYLDESVAGRAAESIRESLKNV